MTADTSVTNSEPVADKPAEQPAPPSAAEPTRQRTWATPKPPVSRDQVDRIGRAALTSIAAVGRFVAGVGRTTGRILRRTVRAVEAIPPALQLFFGAAILMGLGIVGAISLSSTTGLVCTVVVIPVCAATLGALGYRWYSGLGTASPQPRASEPSESDLMRSVHYVDRKLTTALTSFGTEQHQQAVIALFQAKTAVELTLGTEDDPANYADLTLRPDDYGLRPRIGVEPAVREGNTLAS